MQPFSECLVLCLRWTQAVPTDTAANIKERWPRHSRVRMQCKMKDEEDWRCFQTLAVPQYEHVPLDWKGPHGIGL